MGFDFAVALVPRKANIYRELQYIKAALLYADSVTLISPVAYIFQQLTDETYKKNSRQAVKLIQQILAMIKPSHPEVYNESAPIVNEFVNILRKNQFRSIPYVERLKFERHLKDHVYSIGDIIYQLMGNEQCHELDVMIRNKQIKIAQFEHTIDDVDKAVKEYFIHLNDALKNSYALYDEQSNNLMKLAVKDKVIHLSALEQRKITHANMTHSFIQKLPALETATMDELIDIKKELSVPLCRFRSKMLSYSDSLQALPWDNDFENECNILYDKEIVPAILEIKELTEENSFIKNLGNKMFSDKNILKSTGGMVVGIAASGVIASLNDVIASDTSMLIAGSAMVAEKIASAYSDFTQMKKEIKKKDLYFYYQAGELLTKYC